MKPLFIFLVIPVISFSQITIKGKVLDIKKTPLPYTNIVLLNSANGTITNKDGEFELHNASLSDTLKITNIAFIPKIILVSAFNKDNEIILIDSVKELEEVILRDFRSFKLISNLGFASSSNKGEFKLTPGSQLAVYISNTNKREGWIKKITFSIKNFGKCKNSIRLRLLKPDDVTLFPSLDILNENIVIENSDLRRNNSIDVSNYKIIIPPTGVYIMIEWLYPNNGCDKESYTTIAANLETQENLVWLNFRDKKWGHANRPKLPNGNFITPNIGIEVAY